MQMDGASLAMGTAAAASPAQPAVAATTAADASESKTIKLTLGAAEQRCGRQVAARFGIRGRSMPAAKQQKDGSGRNPLGRAGGGGARHQRAGKTGLWGHDGVGW